MHSPKNRHLHLTEKNVGKRCKREHNYWENQAIDKTTDRDPGCRKIQVRKPKHIIRNVTCM